MMSNKTEQLKKLIKIQTEYNDKVLDVLDKETSINENTLFGNLSNSNYTYLDDMITHLKSDINYKNTLFGKIENQFKGFRKPNKTKMANFTDESDDTYFVLKWTPTPFTTSYHVIISKSNSVKYDEIIYGYQTKAFIDVEDLVEETEYDVTIISQNSYGDSEPAEFELTTPEVEVIG